MYIGRPLNSRYVTISAPITRIFFINVRLHVDLGVEALAAACIIYHAFPVAVWEIYKICPKLYIQRVRKNHIIITLFFIR